MEGSQQRKRPFSDDMDFNDKPPAQKRVRFPKGKKARHGEARGVVIAPTVFKEEEAIGPVDLNDPRTAAKERVKRRSQIVPHTDLSIDDKDNLNDQSAAAADDDEKEKKRQQRAKRDSQITAEKERAKRRRQITAELFNDDEDRATLNDVTRAEIGYEEDENFVDDGIQIEPFNLSKEREEGYFDADGNFVEYVREKEIKDAWLDSVEVDRVIVGNSSKLTNNEEENDEDNDREISSEEIGLIKRRIANALEPGETILQALRRMKGSSSKKKEKMSAETQHLFDRLTEDAMKLMENDVYEEKQEVFQREAEGYESVARAKGNLFSDTTSSGLAETSTAADVPINGDDGFDMFADHEEQEPSTNKNVSETNSVPESGSSENDYVYDESSGYYYSSTLGYYFDSSTGLYFSAVSGIWYKFNEETNAYEEVSEAASTES
ncbi:hypothetical protein ACFE04_023744 [Oxalis oulophora]